MEVQKEVFIHGRRTIRGENKCASKWNIFILKREDYMYRTLTFCKFGRYLKGFKYLYQYISIIKMKKINMFNLKNHSNWKKNDGYDSNTLSTENDCLQASANDTDLH